MQETTAKAEKLIGNERSTFYNLSMIVLKIANNYTDILGPLPGKTYQELERKLSFRPQGYQFSPAYNSFIYNDEGKIVRRKWDGWRRQCWKNKKRTYFPTGLYNIAFDYFKTHKIEFKTIDTRCKPDSNIVIELADDFVLRDYQQKRVDIACERSRGILTAATGSGKTAIAAGIIQKLGVAPFVFFVTSTDLLIQTKEAFESFLRQNGKPVHVGQIGGGVVDIADINVMTVQTAVRALGKNWDKKSKFDAEDVDDDKTTPVEQYRKQIVELLLNTRGSTSDEVQHWRSEICQTVNFAMPNCYYRYGTSATPYRDEGDDLLIQACFGREIAQISASELIQQGWLVKPSIKMVHLDGMTSPFRQYQTLYKDLVVENDFYNNAVANVANAYISQNRQVLILVQQISHGKTLEHKIGGSKFLSGASSKKLRKTMLDKLRNKEVSCVISSTIFDEGIDVRSLDTVLLAGQGRSKVRAMQRIGRILRPYEDEKGKKEKATAVDFVIHHSYFEDHGMARRKMYATEPEFEIEDLYLKAT